MRESVSHDMDPQGHLRRGEKYLRRGRLALLFSVLLIVGHLEYLLLPFALNRGGFESVGLLAYPLLLGYLVVAPLYGRRRKDRPPSFRRGE